MKLLVAVAALLVSSMTVAQPLTRPLLQPTDTGFTYVGTFNLPVELWGTDGGIGGGFGLSEDGTYLYITSFWGSLAKVLIPPLGGQASIVYGWVSTPDTVPSAGNVHAAQLEFGPNLYRIKHGEYYTDPTQEFIQVGNPDGTGFTNLFNVGGDIFNARLIAQVLYEIPTEWRTLLDGDLASMGSRLSIVGNAQNGYGFSTFYSSTVGSGDVPVRALLHYTYQNWLEPSPGLPEYPAWPKNSEGGTDLFSYTNAPLATGMIFPGSRSLIYITAHGYGVADNGCRPGSSVHNDPNRVQIVAYDLQDLVDVETGATPNPWDPQPYAWWEWNYDGVHWDSCVGNFPMMHGWGVFDQDSNRLYMSAGGQTVYVWDATPLTVAPSTDNYQAIVDWTDSSTYPNPNDMPEYDIEWRINAGTVTSILDLTSPDHSWALQAVEGDNVEVRVRNRNDNPDGSLSSNWSNWISRLAPGACPFPGDDGGLSFFSAICMTGAQAGELYISKSAGGPFDFACGSWTTNDCVLATSDCGNFAPWKCSVPLTGFSTNTDYWFQWHSPQGTIIQTDVAPRRVP